jgi:hypothetical protein
MSWWLLQNPGDAEIGGEECGPSEPVPGWGDVRYPEELIRQ